MDILLLGILPYLISLAASLRSDAILEKRRQKLQAKIENEPSQLRDIEHADENRVALEEEADLLNKIATYLRWRAAYKEAEPLYRRALKIYETQFGADHPLVATSLNNLAGLLKDQGKFSEAEPLYRRVLEIRETQLGRNHPSSKTVRNNLQDLLSNIKSKGGQ